MNALEIRGLTKHFADFTLEDLNLTLPGGCILGLIGENGAGKSTTIRLILGMLHADSGTVTVLGRDSRENPVLTKQDIGVVLDEVGIPECMTPKQVGKVMANVFLHWNAETYQRLLTRFSLPENKKFKEFSKGMKMKLGLAVALSHEAKLLILDEATSALDNESERLVQQSLEKLAHGRTVFTIAHRLTTIRGADKILVLTEDGIAEQGSHEELIAKGGIYKELYSMYSDMR